VGPTDIQLNNLAPPPAHDADTCDTGLTHYTLVRRNRHEENKKNTHSGALRRRARRVRGKAGQGSKAAEKDPTLLCCAFNKHRLYMFTRREPEDVADATMGRDVFNEKPRAEELVAPEDVAPLPGSNLARGAVICLLCPSTLPHISSSCSHVC
jgi:hypothetical protein